jgi:hypothetical protein
MIQITGAAIVSDAIFIAIMRKLLTGKSTMTESTDAQLATSLMEAAEGSAMTNLSELPAGLPAGRWEAIEAAEGWWAVRAAGSDIAIARATEPVARRIAAIPDTLAEIERLHADRDICHTAACRALQAIGRVKAQANEWEAEMKRLRALHESDQERLRATLAEVDRLRALNAEMREVLCGGDPDLPKLLWPIEWLHTLLSDADKIHAVLDGDDPGAVGMMLDELRTMVTKARAILAKTEA